MTTPKDAGDAEQVKQAKQDTSMHVRLDVAELRELLKLRAFRRFVWNHLAYCGIDDGVYFGDAEAAVFADGKRSAGRMMRSTIMKENPEAYILMMQEQLKDAKND